MPRRLTSFVVFHGLLLEVLEDVRAELSLQAVAEVPEQALQSVPATHTAAGQLCSHTGVLLKDRSAWVKCQTLNPTSSQERTGLHLPSPESITNANSRNWKYGTIIEEQDK